MDDLEDKLVEDTSLLIIKSISLLVVAVEFSDTLGDNRVLLCTKVNKVLHTCLWDQGVEISHKETVQDLELLLDHGFIAFQATTYILDSVYE